MGRCKERVKLFKRTNDYKWLLDGTHLLLAELHGSRFNLSRRFNIHRSKRMTSWPIKATPRLKLRKNSNYYGKFFWR